MYLGDGWLSWHGRTYGLHFSLDASYPSIARECERAIESCVGSPAHSRDRNGGSVCVVYCYRRDWPRLIPQHGPGLKHQRKIALLPWQLAITHQYTREFIRGLIHSDGSRCINRFSVKLPSGRVGLYEYPRYFFTNYSADIRGIFCDHCDLLGIRWTQSNPRNISVSHRDSVAVLDSFVGPKR